MNKTSIIFLQAVIVALGIGALAAMLVEPHFEGRNTHATLFEVYFHDPLLAYAYLASIPFFVALYQGFKALGYAKQNNAFSPEMVRALRTIKHCAIALVAFAAFSFLFLFFADPADDDRPAGVAMRLLVAFPTIVVAAAATTAERILQSGVELKSARA